MKYTEQQLQEAREYAAKVNWQLAEEALTADYYADHVDYNWRVSIKEKNELLAIEIEDGLHDHNFTIAQRMHYFLTGECPALLP